VVSSPRKFKKKGNSTGKTGRPSSFKLGAPENRIHASLKKAKGGGDKNRRVATAAVFREAGRGKKPKLKGKYLLDSRAKQSKKKRQGGKNGVRTSPHT